MARFSILFYFKLPDGPERLLLFFYGNVWRAEAGLRDHREEFHQVKWPCHSGLNMFQKYRLFLPYYLTTQSPIAMQTLTLKPDQNFNTPALDFKKVKSIKLDVDNPAMPKIWILYFYGQFRNARQYVIRIWFFYSEKDRSIQLDRILKQYPNIQIR